MQAKNYYATIWLAVTILVVFAVQKLFPVDFAWQVGSIHMNFFIALVSHGSIAHLLGNLFALVLFGGMSEGIVGTKKYLLVLLLAGIVGNLAGIGSYNRVIGASGAIYGAIGLLAVLRPKMAVWAGGLPMPMILAAVGWAFVDIIGLFANTNTGHLAHLAGIIVGVLFGFSWRKEFPDKKARKKLPKDPALDARLDAWERHYFRQR